jgi:hypothetical protein
MDVLGEDCFVLLKRGEQNVPIFQAACREHARYGHKNILSQARCAINGPLITVRFSTPDELRSSMSHLHVRTAFPSQSRTTDEFDTVSNFVEYGDIVKKKTFLSLQW